MNFSWWTRMFYRKRKLQEEINEKTEIRDEQKTAQAFYVLKAKMEQAHEERIIDHETYDVCRTLLFRLDLLLPYVFIAPLILKERIYKLIAEDAFGIVESYIQIKEENQQHIRSHLLGALRYMSAEAERIIKAIQEYERDAFTNRTSFVSKWYGKKENIFDKL
jgi:hypothetical protein